MASANDFTVQGKQIKEAEVLQTQLSDIDVICVNPDDGVTEVLIEFYKNRVFVNVIENHLIFQKDPRKIDIDRISWNAKKADELSLIISIHICTHQLPSRFVFCLICQITLRLQGKGASQRALPPEKKEWPSIRASTKPSAQCRPSSSSSSIAREMYTSNNSVSKIRSS